MQKLYRLVQAITFAVLLITQHSLQAQNCCVDCQADVKVITNKQVLLEKIEIKEGTTTTLNTNVYVSYRSGNAQKFWANVAIATAGVAVSTQLNSSTPIGAGDSKVQNSISPIVPLGVSVATLPGIWKNRPRGVPQGGLWLQHRDTRGKLTDTWEQPISSEAKNSGELLSINIDKPLSAGTLEVYLQNGSKNPVYYWGLQTIKNTVNLIENKVELANDKTNKSARTAGCPDGYLPNGQGMCCNPFNGDCVSEGGGGTPPPNPTPNPVPQGCPAGYLPNGQGMCCRPGTNDCVSEGSGRTVNTRTQNEQRTIEGTVQSQSTQGGECVIVRVCFDYYTQTCENGACSEWAYAYTSCNSIMECGGGGGGGGNGGNGGNNGGDGSGHGGGGGNGGGGNGDGNGHTFEDPTEKQRCQTRATQDYAIDVNNCTQTFISDWNNSHLIIWGAAGTVSAGAAATAGGACTLVLPFIGTVGCGAVAGVLSFLGVLGAGYWVTANNLSQKLDLCTRNAQIRYNQNLDRCNQ